MNPTMGAQLECVERVSTEALAELCGDLGLTITDGKEGKKSLVYNLIAMHLMSKESDEADEGRAAFEAAGSYPGGKG